MTEHSNSLTTFDPAANAEDLAAFVAASPSSYHAVREAARRLDAAGFQEQAETADFTPASGGRYIIRDGALIAWYTPEAATSSSGFRIVGAHTDSPSFKLKPKSSIDRFGWHQIGVEVYGGALLNSWLDRELCLAGRLTTRDEGLINERLVTTGPVARIPQLAIHLDRGANDGLKLDRQTHVQPIWGAGEAPGDVLAYVASHAVDGEAIDPETILGYDIVLADTQPPRVFGANGEFLASGRLDNISSVHAGVEALTRASAGEVGGNKTLVLAAFDHEEIGSTSRSGAAGPILEDILVRISGSQGGGAEDYRCALANSVCLSSDAGHLVHPNYPGHHDPNNQPQPGAGPLLKINANQRYATDAVGAAIWARACADAGVEYQEFVSNNDVPCGSTIGPITATRLGIRTIDVGLGLLSMHSAREMCHVGDLAALGQALESFYRVE
ncbi:M18 family aminopeptidase [Kocuria sp. TGY1127_2]|uniref:M18 family aminopeptidase n=1 Tax=Kocuria sp. TGY1127_2 TaxID=2711328 RepID=UPI0015C1B820|nr:M18 family aminopeptidase [Kocuria sp. TGY1127_2]